ncbi:hypothetical protein FHS29_003595 [Saccharothrix tamanrassetensis]|uniref:Uncharacterized protein n=1 Tax=Saccharothrix tamanrassetensis TaxID=1051531 RepID=A0A841CEL7_9PSEU|nr:hypothetical protein [Saccharothrix tamanrassetensis]MBB5957002.1 hypothetical protein [Saccharothrix tamanrassetensis]
MRRVRARLERGGLNTNDAVLSFEEFVAEMVAEDAPRLLSRPPDVSARLVWVDQSSSARA